MTGASLVVQGDALHLPLPDESVDLVVTSPPYFALRSYEAGPGQLGSEATPAEYLEALWAATAELKRVLKPSGSIFVDLGDKYNTQAGNTNAVPVMHGNGTRATGYQAGQGRRPAAAMPHKSLMLLPERYRIGCVDRLGLIARAVIVWNKPNGLPESVNDRVRRSHEDWVHLTKQPRYYSAIDEVREPLSDWSQKALEGRWTRKSQAGTAKERKDAVSLNGAGRNYAEGLNPLGKLPGSVWNIPSESLRLPDWVGVDHYAAFPSEWPRRLILGWSPPGICMDCGQGRVPVVEREVTAWNSGRGGDESAGRVTLSRPSRPDGQHPLTVTSTILGYACACTPHTNHPGTGEPSGPDKRYGNHLADGKGYPNMAGRPAKRTDGGGGPGLEDRPKVGPWREYHLDGWTPPPTRPAVILDPFGGTGTTAMVARALGRVGLSFDLSHAYSRAARWRIRYDAAKAISRTNLERQGSLL